jgi:cyanophycinase
VVHKKTKGKLIIIGGHEDKEGKAEILQEVARKAHGRKGHLLLVTIATQFPREVADEYTKAFKRLGVHQIDVLDIRSREEAKREENVAKIRDAAVIFFTGGDQLRITSQMADSPVFRCLQEVHEDGVTIAGTSAGAAVMPETMLISGKGDESNHVTTLGMAPGLGLLQDVVIDSHFAERGRFGRLLGAVVQNPKNLGLGIDENTALVVQRGECFEVLGSGAVYVFDGTGVSYSSLSERNPEGIVSVFNIKVHVLGAGDRYDLAAKLPVIPEDVGQPTDTHASAPSKSHSSSNGAATHTSKTRA